MVPFGYSVTAKDHFFVYHSQSFSIRRYKTYSMSILNMKTLLGFKLDGGWLLAVLYQELLSDTSSSSVPLSSVSSRNVM